MTNSQTLTKSNLLGAARLVNTANASPPGDGETIGFNHANGPPAVGCRADGTADRLIERRQTVSVRQAQPTAERSSWTSVVPQQWNSPVHVSGFVEPGSIGAPKNDLKIPRTATGFLERLQLPEQANGCFGDPTIWGRGEFLKDIRQFLWD